MNFTICKRVDVSIIVLCALNRFDPKTHALAWLGLEAARTGMGGVNK
jgi:hypothetical protein